ncbi:MAG: hypothetical protein JNK56_03485 [Myxococcales bacterium]|nr:hypothetical protein [Myxococcales bacterium]
MGQLHAHASRRAKVLLKQAEHEQDFADRIARDRHPRERRLLVELRFRARHLRRLARLWQAFAGRKP